MTSPQADDINRAIVHAWRDPEYAASLSPETRDAMPPAPESIGALTDDQLVEMLNEDMRMPLSDDQLLVAAGAGSNGQNYNDAYAKGMEGNAYGTPGDSDSAQLAAQSSPGVATD